MDELNRLNEMIAAEEPETIESFDRSRLVTLISQSQDIMDQVLKSSSLRPGNYSGSLSQLGFIP